MPPQIIAQLPTPQDLPKQIGGGDPELEELRRKQKEEIDKARTQKVEKSPEQKASDEEIERLRNKYGGSVPGSADKEKEPKPPAACRDVFCPTGIVQTAAPMGARLHYNVYRNLPASISRVSLAGAEATTIEAGITHGFVAKPIAGAIAKEGAKQGVRAGAKYALLRGGTWVAGRGLPYLGAVLAAIDCGIDINEAYNADEKERSGAITRAAVNVGCTVAGAVIGQILIPIPGVGAAIGAGIGNLVGNMAKCLIGKGFSFKSLFGR